jgi:hypothetical protein
VIEAERSERRSEATPGLLARMEALSDVEVPLPESRRSNAFEV